MLLRAHRVHHRHPPLRREERHLRLPARGPRDEHVQHPGQHRRGVLDCLAGVLLEVARAEADDLRTEPQRAGRERRPCSRRGFPEVDTDDPALQWFRRAHRTRGELRAAPDQMSQVVVVEIADREQVSHREPSLCPSLGLAGGDQRPVQ
jgi:hypothetical protein